ncbi:MAG: SDR family oxidoreductase [Burkholderiales bacterium]|nr:SDR family oxidoreductase [Burkholderiales bacterium]
MGMLADKVCVITGGAGSVGLASARRFLAEGAKVVLVDLHEEALGRAAGELAAPRGRVATQVCDVSDAAQVRSALDAAVAAFGPIDVLFSNAGNAGHNAPLADYPEEAFDRTLAIHARGAFLACKYGLPRMRDGGSLIIMSSLAGVRGGVGTNISYVAAKHAQIGIMRTATKPAAVRQIRVNCINPGPVDNEFQTGIEVAMSRILGVNVTEELNRTIPLKRHARADEIAGVALFLASDLSTYVTGAVLMVDGGLMS